MLVLACASPARVADCTSLTTCSPVKCGGWLLLSSCASLMSSSLLSALGGYVGYADSAGGATPFRVIGSERLRCTEMLEEDSWITDLLRWTSCAVPSTWPKAGEQLKRCTARIEVLYIYITGSKEYIGA